MALTSKQYKDISIKEFTKAIAKYEICKGMRLHAVIRKIS